MWEQLEVCKMRCITDFASGVMVKAAWELEWDVEGNGKGGGGVVVNRPGYRR